MLGPCFNLFKVKYEVLLYLLRETKGINIGLKDTVNIFIDLEPILMKLSNPGINDYIKANSNQVMFEYIANVVNLAAHYRWFFTKNKIQSRIYLCMPSLTAGSFKNEIYHTDYRKYFKYKFKEDAMNNPLASIVKQSDEYIKLITEYIQGVYYIDSNSVENSVVPYAIKEYNDDNSINFIVTNSLYNFQYVNHKFNIIIPRKEDSVILTRYSVMEFITDIYKCKEEYDVGPGFLPFIISIVGSKYRNIYNIKRMQMKSTLKLLQKALDEGMITNGITNIHMLLQILIPSIRGQVTLNYNLTDIETQFDRLNKKDLFGIYDQLIDKLDNVSLKKLNDKHFTKEPLMLIELTTIPYQGNVKF